MYDMSKDTLRKFCTDYNNSRGGDFKNLSDGCWWDWFCRESSLPAKTEKLGAKVCILAQSKKLDKDSMYVWFKNSCPMQGHLFDEIKFSDRKTKDVIYVVVPKSGFTKDKGKAFVWGRPNFKEPRVEGTWADVKKFFGV